MRIREADNLAGVTWIGENFLISGEAGIENDFAAAPRDRARRAPMKNSPVFERKGSLPCFGFRQWILFPASADFTSMSVQLHPHLLELYFTDSANTGIEPK